MNPSYPHNLRFRQVHLDFHTSGDIPGIGEKFSKAQFQEALKRGHVDSVTVFSKCHHGYSYHPTKVGTVHPHLKRDLLAEQIEACREIGVRCPIYISAGFDEVSAYAHPEWLIVDKNGVTKNPISGNGWYCMNFSTGYLDYLCAQIEEVVQRWPDNDGIFLDIITPWKDYSRASLVKMREMGLDPLRDADVATYAQHVLVNYYERTTAAVRSVRADTPVFHNGGHIPIGAEKFNFFNSHFELESLPTGGWGYDHFPLSARYAITQPRDFLGMTGKFHTTWGEFGGFKRPAALQYECAAMLANGAKCSVGDQLHPSGEMNMDTYELIAPAYAEVEAKEAWTRQVTPAARIAIVSAERSQGAARSAETASIADEGASRLLLELHLPFVVLDEHGSWEGFDVVILPDGLVLTPEATAKAEAFLKNGGRIIAAGSALLDETATAFALNPGAEFVGRSPFEPDYLVATALTPEVPVRSAILIEKGAYEIKPTNAQVLIGRRNPYFNRTWAHHCSHQHAPDAPEAATPAAVFGNGIVYFAHNIFSQYRLRGQPLYRDFVRAALVQLFPEGLPVTTSLPSVARFNLLEQPAENRYVAHLLYAPISLRAHIPIWGTEKPTEIIEELLPLYDSQVTLRLPRPITQATLAPEGTPLPFTQEGNTVTFTVAKFTGHQMVVLGYA